MPDKIVRASPITISFISKKQDSNKSLIASSGSRHCYAINSNLAQKQLSGNANLSGLTHGMVFLQTLLNFDGKLAAPEATLVGEAVYSPRLVRFGVFEVDLRAGELRKAGVKLKLSGQPFQVLSILLQCPGAVVTRDELHKRLWPDTFVDVDHNLNTAINKIREVLDDCAEHPRFVETLPRRGYRFIGRLEGADRGSRRTPILAALLLSIALIVVLFVLVSLNVHGWRDRLFVSPSRIQSLAVLPFENLSNASEQEYVSDGMTDALIASLGQIGGPRIVSRRSTTQFKGTKMSLQAIARELNVDAIVEGTVTRNEDRVLVTVHLAQAFPERQLWAGQYNRSVRDVLTLQSEIARTVADEINVRLTPKQQGALTNRTPVDPEAHLEYLRGLYFENKDTELDLRTAVTHFTNAVAKDPTYAAAYAELAMTYVQLGRATINGPPVKDTEPPARAAVTKALELDPHSRAPIWCWGCLQGMTGIGRRRSVNIELPSAEIRIARSALSTTRHFSKC